MKLPKDCPYHKIQDIEAHIKIKKQMLAYIQEETMQYEKALIQSDIKQLKTLEKICYDGFSGPSLEVENRRLEDLLDIKESKTSTIQKTKCRVCLYNPKKCQDLLAFKESRLLFFRQRIREVNAYHNQLVDLAHVICNKTSLLENRPSTEQIIFYKYPIPSIVCFNWADFKPSRSERYTYEIIYYDEKISKIKEEKLSYVYEASSNALQGTYLGNGAQEIKLIKIEFPEEKIQLLEEATLNGLHVHIKKLNQLFKRRYGPIQGLYIELPRRVIASESGFKKRIKKLGYQIVGKVNEQGIFEKDRLLVYLYK